MFAMLAPMSDPVHSAQHNPFTNTLLHRTLRSNVLVTRQLYRKGGGDWRDRCQSRTFWIHRIPRAARTLIESGSPRGRLLPNDLKPVENKQIWAVDKAMSADIVPDAIGVSGELEGTWDIKLASSSNGAQPQSCRREWQSCTTRGGWDPLRIEDGWHTHLVTRIRLVHLQNPVPAEGVWKSA